MFRLAVMVLICLIAIWLTMLTVTPGRRPDAPAPVTDTAPQVLPLPDLVPLPDPEPRSTPAAPPATPPAAQAGTGTTDAPTASALAPDMQGAGAAAARDAAAAPARYRSPDMPGPPLRPSPQYPDQIAPDPEADTAATAGSPETTTGQRRVTASRLNLRAGPGTGHAVIGAVDNGDLVTPLAPAADGWQQIRTGDGTTGYLSTQFLSGPLP